MPPINISLFFKSSMVLAALVCHATVTFAIEDNRPIQLKRAA